MSHVAMEDSLTREEAKRILRRLELDAYSSLITAFRAQGDLSREKKSALNDLATHLSISTERHRAEVRRVVSDNRIGAVAECMHGPGTETEWSIEGRRLVSLTPRLVPQTAFTAKASHSANAVAGENSKLTLKKVPSQIVKEKSNLSASLLSDKLPDKNHTGDLKQQEPSNTRTASTSSNSSSKSQDGEKSKKKKKAATIVNKVSKPSKLSVQSKPDFKSSTPNLSKSTILSPEKMQRVGFESSPKYHQKPLILQRSPQKTTPMRPDFADMKAISSHANSCITTTKQQFAGRTSGQGMSSPFGHRMFQENAEPSFQPSSSHNLISSNGSPLAQKMKFKTPMQKNRGKPAKPRTPTHLQQPSCIIVSSGNAVVASDTLNALGAPTAVPMAPISPVKPHIPSSAASALQVKSCSVKVVQVQKSNATNLSSNTIASMSSKAIVAPSSSTKISNSQRLLTLSNSGSQQIKNQQLKIASIPNALQQSTSKIVSIAKSAPMTTGFKMIAVTTVVPGSTQVKTVYIATPILSVTKPSSSTATPVTTFQISQTKAAQTYMSPSSHAALAKPSLGLLNARTHAPAATSSSPSAITTPLLGSPASKFVTALSSTSVTAKVISCTDAANSQKVVRKANDKSIVTNKKQLVNSELSPERKTLQSPPFNSNCKSQATSLTASISSKSSPKVFNSEVRPFKFADGTSRNESDAIAVSSAAHIREGSCEITKDSLGTQNTADPPKGVEAATENTDESILLAGEQFLADLAAKLSQHSVQNTKPSITNSSVFKCHVPSTTLSAHGQQSRVVHDNESARSLTKQHVERVKSPEKKVIVRAIADEFDPLSIGSLNFDCDINDSLTFESSFPAKISVSDSSRVAFCSSISEKTAKTSIRNSTFLVESNSHKSPTPIIGPCLLSTIQEQGTTKLHRGNDLTPISSLRGNKVSSPMVEASTVSSSSSSSVVSSIFTTTQKSSVVQHVSDSSCSLITTKSIPTGFTKLELKDKVLLDKKPPRGSVSAITMTSPTPVQPLSSNTISPISSKRSPQSLKVSDPHFSTPKGSSHIDVSRAGGITFCNDVTSPSISTIQSLMNPAGQVSRNVVNNVNVIPGPKLDKQTVSSDPATVCSTQTLTSPLNSPPSTPIFSSAVPGTTNGHDLSRSFKTSPKKSLPHANISPSSNTKQLMENCTGTGLQGRLPGQSVLNSELAVQIPLAKRSSPENLKKVMSSLESTGLDRSLITRTQGDGKKTAMTSSPRKRKSESASRIQTSWSRGAMNLLLKVSRFRGPNKQKGEMNASSWFTRPVIPEEAPGYYKMIKKPMDLSTIKKKLEDGVYKDNTEFYADMHLIKSNCYAYNPAEHIVRKDCDLVFAFFEEEYLKLVKKWQSPNSSPNKKTRLGGSPEKAV